MKLYWDKTYEYQRILEILEDYWTSEADEEAVIVKMRFKKHNGEYQAKSIRWKNPRYKEKMDLQDIELMSGSDLMKMTHEELLISTARADDKFLGIER